MSTSPVSGTGLAGMGASQGSDILLLHSHMYCGGPMSFRLGER